MAGFTACLVANWPGHFPPDAIWQLAQGRAGAYNDWHPPVMAWMLGLADQIIPGAPLFFVFDATLFFAALGAMGLLGQRRWLAAGLLALLCASPLALDYQGLVVKDVLFADASVAGFALLAWAGRLWPRPIARLSLLGGALAAFTLAALARQNGLIVGFAGAGALAAIAWRHGAKRARAAVCGLLALLLVGAGFGAASAALDALRDEPPEGRRLLAELQLYDLAAALDRQPALGLPVLRARDPALESFLRRHAAAYSPTRVDTLARTPGWDAMARGGLTAVDDQWRALIGGHTGLYLRLRWTAFAQVLATPAIKACAPILVGVDPGRPDLLAEAGLSARESAKDDWDASYMEAFLPTPIFSHLTYGLLALVLFALSAREAWRGGQSESFAVMGLLLAALAVTASYFVISLACDYRYLYFLDAAAMAALLHRAASLPAPPSKGKERL